MIGKSMFYLAIVISSGFAIERTVVNTGSWKDRGIDKEFIAATELARSLEGKRGVFGEDTEGQFFSLYEKNPNQPERTIVKFIRARNDRPNKRMLEYFEYDAGTVSGAIKNEGSFRLSSGEIKKRLAQNGPTY